jgi:hypothetical protein
MARMRDDVPIEYKLKECFFSDFDLNFTEAAFAEFGFPSLLKRIPFKTHAVIQTLFKM